jgi:hypothetical protein
VETLMQYATSEMNKPLLTILIILCKSDYFVSVAYTIIIINNIYVFVF